MSSTRDETTQPLNCPRYCSLVQLDPVETLRECARERMENFLHWLLKTFTIKKTSTVTTYWRQLSQLYIKWENRRMDPQVLRQMFVVSTSSPLVLDTES